MRNSIILACAAASFAVVGCDNAAEEPAGADIAVDEPAAEIAPTAIDGGPIEGTYEAVSNEGLTVTQVLAADGTIHTTFSDGQVVEGTYGDVGPDTFCWTGNGETEANCFDLSMNDDGTWTAVNQADAAETWTVRRVES